MDLYSVDCMGCRRGPQWLTVMWIRVIDSFIPICCNSVFRNGISPLWCGKNPSLCMKKRPGMGIIALPQLCAFTLGLPLACMCVQLVSLEHPDWLNKMHEI